jgi:hypothetical protein
VTPEIQAEIVGGDAFIQLSVSPGTELLIHGYAAEPYLWFDAAGQIWENQRSPATYYNAERFGADVPEIADPTAEPDWKRIGSGHVWAWHDHRIHRMDPFPPLNSSPGEQILDAVVPVIVNGAAVEIHVISVWMPSPSPIPMLLGVSLGLLGVGWWFQSRRRFPLISSSSLRYAGWLLAPLAALAVIIGLWQFLSLPASTGPLWTWWLLPLVAVLAATSAVFSTGSSRVSAGAGLAIAGSQLLLWAFQRRSGLWTAILPTDAPWWLDRTVTAAVVPVAVLAFGLGLGVLGSGFNPGRRQSQP